LSSFSFSGIPDIGGIVREPQHMVRHHPPIGKIDILLKLDCNDFGIHLHNHAGNPTALPFPFFVIMVAVHLDNIADIEIFTIIWFGFKTNF